MDKRVVITGLGVVSSIGIGQNAFWQSLLEGNSGISDISGFDTSRHFTRKGGQVKDFVPGNRLSEIKSGRLSRASQFAVEAAGLAIQDAGLDPGGVQVANAGVCIGTNIGSVQSVERLNELIVQNRMDEINRDLFLQIPTNSTSSVVAREFNCEGANAMFSTACSAGNYAIGYGFDLIKLGRAELMLVGGADAFSKVAFTGFNQFSAVDPDRCRPFDKQRKGMMVAEGAGILVLESRESAIRRGASVYAEILGYGLSCDAHHMTASSIEGLAQCMIKALSEAGCSPDDVDYISAHGTGTPTNDKNECAAMRQVFGERSRSIPASSIKSMLGHTMGAASALEAIACALVVRNDIIPPTINFETPDPDCDIDCVPNVPRRQNVGVAINNSYAFGGNNASLVLKKVNGKDRHVGFNRERDQVDNR